LCRNCRSVANGIKSYFSRSAVGGQPISVLVTSNAVNGKTFLAIPFSRATATAAMERRNGTTERRKGNGKTAMAERQWNAGN